LELVLLKLEDMLDELSDDVLELLDSDGTGGLGSLELLLALELLDSDGTGGLGSLEALLSLELLLVLELLDSDGTGGLGSLEAVLSLELLLVLELELIDEFDELFEELVDEELLLDDDELDELLGHTPHS